MLRRILTIIFILAILGAIAFAGFQFIANFTYTRHITLPPSLLAGSSTDAGSNASSTSSALPGAFGPNDRPDISPASSTLDVSSWKIHTDTGLGYLVSYPGNMIVNTDASGGLILAFPKDSYFHWPLLDDARITISASSTCVQSQVPSMLPPVSVMINGRSFSRTEGTDAAAGNAYRELAYDTISAGVCYHISLFDHGANGAGLYVSDQSLISGYDAQHMADLGAILDIFNAVVNSFRLL